MPRLRHVSAALLTLALLTWSAVGLAGPDTAKKQETTLHHALGAAMASSLYHTHLFISSTADGHKAHAYDPAQIQAALKASVDVTADLTDNLERVKRAPLSKEDAAQFGELIVISKMVMRETQLFSGFVQNPSPETQRAFAEHHLVVRVRLNKLLGM